MFFFPDLKNGRGGLSRDVRVGCQKGRPQESPFGVDVGDFEPSAVAGTEILVGEALAQHDVPLEATLK